MAMSLRFTAARMISTCDTRDRASRPSISSDIVAAFAWMRPR